MVDDKDQSRGKDRRRRHDAFAVRPPELTVLSDLPIEQSHGHFAGFDLETRVGPIYDILRHEGTEMPLTIAICGAWGTGKTTAMRWLESLLSTWTAEVRTSGRGDAVKTIWFDPWKYSTKEEVWRGLLAEVIIESVDVETATLGTVKKAVMDFGAFLGRSFVHTMAGLKLKASVPGGGLGAEISLSGVKEIMDEYRETAHPERGYLNGFENTFERWLTETLGEKERIVVFIDDLDRCLPEVALQVLEALKLYLAIPRLIFVVGVDKNVIEELVTEHYNALGLDELKGHKYLAKMFQVELELLPSDVEIEGFPTNS